MAKKMMILWVCLVLLVPCLSVASAGTDLSGYWSIKLNDGKTGWMTLRIKGPSPLPQQTYYEGTIFLRNAYNFQCTPNNPQCNDYKYSVYGHVPNDLQPGKGFTLAPSNGSTGTDDAIFCMLETPKFFTGYFRWADGRYKFPGETNFTAHRRD